MIDQETLGASIAYTKAHGGGGGGGDVTGVKGDAESTYRKGNVNITPANIGLGNVDNTSDLNKPVSTAQQTALDGKVDKVAGKGLSENDYTDADKAIVDGVTSALSDKVDKVTGKGLSSNDYTNADKAIVDGVTSALAGKQDTLTFDNVPTQSSNNPVKSGGVKTYVDNAVSQLNDEIATKQNTLTIVDISSQATIDTTNVQDFKAYTYGKLIYIHLTLKPGVTDQSNVVTNLPYIIHGNYGVLPMFYMNDVDADSNGVCVYIDRTIQYRGSTTQGTGGTQYSSMFFIV